MAWQALGELTQAHSADADRRSFLVQAEVFAGLITSNYIKVEGTQPCLTPHPRTRLAGRSHSFDHSSIQSDGHRGICLPGGAGLASGSEKINPA